MPGRRPAARHAWWRPDNPAAAPRSAGAAFVLCAMFTLMVIVTRAFCRDADNSTPFWPANGFLVAALVALPLRLSVPVCGASLAINIGINLTTPYTVTEDVIYAFGNVLMSTTAALLTRHYCGARSDLSRFRRLVPFVPISFFAAMVEATFGEALVPTGTGTELIDDWLQWSLCDGLGVMMATPVALLALNPPLRASGANATLPERMALFVVAAAITALGFAYARSSICLLIYPVLILTAFRAGPAWVLASILLNALIASAFTCQGLGPIAFLARAAHMNLQHALQPFLISMFFSAVPANNALGEKNRAAWRLHSLKDFVEKAAAHDALTGLLNRKAFRRRLSAKIRLQAGFTLLLVDLDRFKEVNDTMGHPAGDRLLQVFAARLKHLAADNATVARLGGDEFAVLLASTDHGPHLSALCDTIILAAQTPFVLDNHVAYVGASVGVAISGEPGLDADEIMRRADVALYDAKAKGRSQCCFFSFELDHAAFERSSLKADLRTALERGDQLHLYYQPREGQARPGAPGGSRLAVEALLRWAHPAKGLLPTDIVIAAAEESGLILLLGAWVLHEALGFATRWPDLDVAVNVSPVQLRHPDFIDSVLRAIAESGVDPKRLELEITETAIIEDVELITEKLGTLRRLGIRIALDDFGTGFSSLQHLQRYAVDRLKIDRSFVGSLESSPQAAAIVTAVISLGHAMGLQVTAEGVETPAQRRFLIDAEVDELQGFLIGRPIPECEFAEQRRAVGNADHATDPLGLHV